MTRVDMRSTDPKVGRAMRDAIRNTGNGAGTPVTPSAMVILTGRISVPTTR